MNRSLLLLLLCGLVSFSANASTFLAMDQEALIRGSDACVHGRVVRVESFWNDTRSMIFTEAMVQVEDQLIGRSKKLVVVRTAGGEVDGFVVEAHGFPTFTEDQEVIVFLKDEGEYSRVTGYQLGLYKVERQMTGEPMAIPSVDGGVHFIRAEGEETVAPMPVARSLAELKQSIRSDALRMGRTTD